MLIISSLICSPALISVITTVQWVGNRRGAFMPQPQSQTISSTRTSSIWRTRCVGNSKMGGFLSIQTPNVWRDDFIGASLNMQQRLRAQQSHIDLVGKPVKNPNHINVILRKQFIQMEMTSFQQQMWWRIPWCLEGSLPNRLSPWTKHTQCCHYQRSHRNNGNDFDKNHKFKVDAHLVMWSNGSAKNQ